MEAVLEVYARPYDPESPPVWMDELSKQLIGQIRVRLPAKPGPPERYDSEYERNGTANVFFAIEPVIGKKTISVTARRTKADWAIWRRELIDNRYPNATKIILVSDNLNSPTSASFYQAFSPAEARRLTKKIEFHYTPQHGSWLNMAETGRRVRSRQCLDRRISDREPWQKEIAAWEEADRKKPVKIVWRFTTADAGIKLQKLYPSVESC